MGSVLAPVRLAGPLGSGSLHDLLAVGVAERGQPGAIAAGALHRPRAPLGHVRAGDIEELLLAGSGGGRGDLGEDPTDRGERGGGEGARGGCRHR